MNNITFEYIIITFQAINKRSVSDPQVLVLKMIFYPLNIILAQSFVVFRFFFSDRGISKVEDFCENRERPLL